MLILWITAGGTDIKAIEKSIRALEKSKAYRNNPALADSLARLYVERCTYKANTYKANIPDCDKAISIYEKYVKDSDLPRAKALIRKAEVQKGKGEYEAAMTTYREAIGAIGKGTSWEKGGMIELTTNVNLMLSAIGNYYLMKGLLALNNSNYTEAATYLDAAVKYLTRAGTTRQGCGLLP